MSLIPAMLMIAAAWGQEPQPQSPPSPAASQEQGGYLMNSKDAFVPYGTSNFAEPYASGMLQDSSDATSPEGVAPTPEAVDPTGR